MNDYGPLRDYLKKQMLPELVLSFEEIEAILDAPLPRAAQRALAGGNPLRSHRRRCRSARPVSRPAMSPRARRTATA